MGLIMAEVTKPELVARRIVMASGGDTGPPARVYRDVPTRVASFPGCQNRALRLGDKS